jgi:hypothetical protein
VVAPVVSGVVDPVVAGVVEPACEVVPVEPVAVDGDDAVEVVDAVDVVDGGGLAGGVELTGSGDLAGWAFVVSGLGIGLISAAATTGSASSSRTAQRADGRMRSRISAMIRHLASARKGGGR